MAVSPRAQGKSIGFLLGQACINKAKQLGAEKVNLKKKKKKKQILIYKTKQNNTVTVYLESNTLFKPAINLYLKLGFQKITGPPSPYERSNIQMVLLLFFFFFVFFVFSL